MSFDPFIKEPMLGMVLAPFVCIGVELEVSCFGGRGDGERECGECWLGCWTNGDGIMSLGSIFDMGGVDDGGRFCE